MSELPEIKLMKLSLNLYRCIGETKIDASKKQVLFRVLNINIMTLALFYAFANFFIVNVEMYIETLQSFLFFAHILLKYSSFLSYKNSIKILLNNIKIYSWDYQTWEATYREKIGKIFKLVEDVQALLLILGVFGVLLYCTKPFFAINKGLLSESLIPQSYTMDAILLLSQFYCFWIGVLLVLAYDFFYFTLCIHLILQVRLIKHKIRSILDNRNYRTKFEIIGCVRHHKFLLKIFVQMQDIYSMMLLFHYLVTLISSCVILLELFLRNTNFASYVTALLTLFVFIGQFALYAFPAEQIAGEFISIGDAIYISHWYRNNVLNQKLLLYVMVMAQRIRYFSGAGLVNINIDTFESIFRKSFSLCAIFRNLMDK